MDNTDSSQQYQLIAEIEFNDKCGPEFHLIHKGTENECKDIMDMLPAIVYTGARSPISSTLHIVPNCVE